MKKCRVNSLLICLFTLFLFLFGCMGTKIKLVNTELKVSNIVEQPYLHVYDEERYSEEFQNNVYYRFDFETDIPLVNFGGGRFSMIQTRLKFIKNGKKMAYFLGRGPYSISRQEFTLNENLKLNYYTALFFKSLEFYSDETRSSKPLKDLDFDYLEIQVVYPNMILPFIFESNVTTYSRSHFFEQISKKRETLTIVEKAEDIKKIAE